MRLIAVAVTAATLLLAACGGGGGGGSGEPSYPTKPTSVGPIGQGADGVWIFSPAGKPKSLVIFFHGQGGAVEATPVNHQPWINHLVAEGNAVVYPRYEMAYERAIMSHVVAGVRTAVERLQLRDPPVMVIGYSRGGALALEYGATAPDASLPVPDAILSVFPSGWGESTSELSLKDLDDHTRVLFFIGQEDEVVGNFGVRILVQRLQRAAFPGGQIQLRFVDSRGAFTANHFAPLDTSGAAKAAFWSPADSMLHEIEREPGS